MTQGIDCFPLSQVKVGSFCFNGPVRRAGCGGLLVSTDCVRWWRWCALCAPLPPSPPRFCGMPWKHLTNFLKSQILTFFLVGGPSVRILGSHSGVGWEPWGFEDYIRFISCHLFGPVNHGQNWKGWERSGEKGLIISDFSVIHSKTSLKGLILIILSTYQTW